MATTASPKILRPLRSSATYVCLETNPLLFSFPERPLAIVARLTLVCLLYSKVPNSAAARAYVAAPLSDHDD